MTAMEIAREVFPEVGDDFLSFILSESARFASVEGDTAEESLRRWFVTFRQECGLGEGARGEIRR